MNMNTLEFDVTQEHIDAGVALQPGHCAVALGAKAAGLNVEVTMSAIMLNCDSITWATDKALRRFISHFDAYKDVGISNGISYAPAPCRVRLTNSPDGQGIAEYIPIESNTDVAVIDALQKEKEYECVGV